MRLVAVVGCAVGIAGCDRVLGLRPPIDAPVDTDLGNGLVALYKMEDVVDFVVRDEVGGHPARCIACPVSTMGQRENALEFGGMQLLRVTSSERLETTVPLTVALWINVPMAPMAYECPLGKVFGAADGNSWQLCLTSLLEMVVFTKTPTDRNNFVFGTVPLAAGSWHHIALRWDRTRTLFLDGFADRRDTEEVTLQFDAGEVVIGGDLDAGSPVAGFHGAIDDVRIYARALSDDDVFFLARR